MPTEENNNIDLWNNDYEEYRVLKNSPIIKCSYCHNEDMVSLSLWPADIIENPEKLRTGIGLSGMISCAKCYHFTEVIFQMVKSYDRGT
jgi:hypothetical protein